MSKRKGMKKRYLFTISSILLAIFSVIFLRFFDINFDRQKEMTEKEIRAIMEFNNDFFDEVRGEKTLNKAKLLRDKFASKISYKKLFDKKADFKNFKYLPDKDIYGFQLLNNAHVGFFYNSDECGTINSGDDFCAGVVVDVNGYTKPNRFGQDQLLLKIYKNGVVK